jgi:hypothetical protein
MLRTNSKHNKRKKLLLSPLTLKIRKKVRRRRKLIQLKKNLKPRPQLLLQPLPQPLLPHLPSNQVKVLLKAVLKLKLRLKLNPNIRKN